MLVYQRVDHIITHKMLRHEENQDQQEQWLLNPRWLMVSAIQTNTVRGLSLVITIHNGNCQ